MKKVLTALGTQILTASQFACLTMLARVFKTHFSHFFSPSKVFLACLIYCSSGIESVEIVCCVGEQNDASGQGMCSIPSNLSSIDDVLQKGNTCFGSCLKQPNCTTFAYDSNNCTLGCTAVPDCFEYLVSRANILFHMISTRFVGKPEGSGGGGGVSDVFLTYFDYFFGKVNTTWGVESRGVPNFGSELGLGRVSYYSANTRTRTYNASEYLIV